MDGLGTSKGISEFSKNDTISEKSELTVAKTLKELGVCDGVTGKFEHCTVDGIDFEKHMILLQKLRDILS